MCIKSNVPSFRSLNISIFNGKIYKITLIGNYSLIKYFFKKFIYNQNYFKNRLRN